MSVKPNERIVAPEFAKSVTAEASEFEFDEQPLLTDDTGPKREVVIKWVVRLGAIAAVLIAWQLYASSVNPILLAPPTSVAKSMGHLFANGQMTSAIGISLEALAIGFSAGFVAAVSFGLIWARFKVVDWAAQPFISALWSTPLIALVPVYVLWFGFGLLCQVLIIASFTFFPVLLNTYQGATTVDRTFLDVAKSFRCNNRQMWRHVTLPSCVPYILAGLNVAVGHALTGMVIAEFYTNSTGLGGIVLLSTNTFQTAEAFAPIVVLMVIGILGIGSTRFLKRRFAGWADIASS